MILVSSLGVAEQVEFNEGWDFFLACGIEEKWNGTAVDKSFELMDL